MCDGILIRLASGEVCFPLYKQVLQWPPKPGPGPDPFHHLIDDLSSIALLNKVVAHIGHDGVRSQLGQAVQAALKTMAHQLPAGVSIGDGLMKASAAG